MAEAKRDGKVRVGIAGLDHWYIGLAAAEAAAAHPDVELVVVAHRDGARAEETAESFGAAEATTDYGSVACRDDLDILITACRTSENPDLCVEAAGRGTNILSVKPIALTREESYRVRDAVDKASVRFFSWESNYRLKGSYRQIKRWIDERRIGHPISAAFVLRSSLPTLIWPGVQGQSWWLDPAHVPGGGWIDHSIYAIDAFPWLFGSEVDSAGGLLSNLVHSDLPEGIEDFGLATLHFGGGQIASVEVTWTGAPGAFLSTMQIVGSEGSVLFDSSTPSRITVSGHFEPFQGWSSVALPRDGDETPLAAMVRAIREGIPLPAGVDDACRNLDVCLTFYEAAHDGCTRKVGGSSAS